MRNARRIPVTLLAAALVALCLVGQVAAVAPAHAGTSAPGATEVGGSGTLTRGEAPALPSGPKPAAVQRLRAYYSLGTPTVPNDGFGSAIVIGAVPYTNTQSVEGATTAGDDPTFSVCWQGFGPRNRTVWYRYTSPSAQTLIVDTLGSNYDTMLGVWTGSQGSLVNVGCSDDAAAGFSHSRVEFGAVAGTTYYIEAVDFYAASATSQLTLNLTSTTPPGAFNKTAPANGATGVALSPTLSWQALANALWYGYCYDTTDNDTCDPGSWQDSGEATSAVLSGLSPNTTYYWQVFASTSPSPVYGNGGEWWSFTTGGSVPVSATFKSVAVNDGWVLESSETSGVGGSLNSTATTCRVGDDAANRQYRAILDFNTASLPNNAVITGVALRIKSSSVVGTNPLGTHGKLIADVRRGNFSGNLALVSADFQAAASKLSAGTFGTVPVSGWYRTDLLASAYSKVNVKGHTQFRLRFAKDDNNDNGADYLAFFCGNAPVASRPQLIITYYVP